MALERVQKILARAGIASRRRSEEMILGGAVTINGKLAQLGDKADFGKDAIKVNGKLLQKVETPTYIAFYKPRAVISALVDPEGRPALDSYLTSVKNRVYPIGRLDFLSEGLLLLTNDGDFAEKIQKRDDIVRVYHVKVKGHPDRDALGRLTRGMRTGGKSIHPYSVRVVDDFSTKSRIEIVMKGAGAVDLKSYVEMKGILVDRIVRTAVGHVTLKGLKPGELRYLKASQAMSILEQPELALRKIEEEAKETAEHAPRRDQRLRRKAEERLASTTHHRPAGAKPFKIKPRAADSTKIIVTKKTSGGAALREQPPRGRGRDRDRERDFDRRGPGARGPRAPKQFGSPRRGGPKPRFGR